MPSLTLAALNDATAADFIAALADIFEEAPWVAEAAVSGRPYATVAALHEAMMSAVRQAPPAAQTAFLRGHPELAGSAAASGTMGAASTAEQAALGLSQPNPTFAGLPAWNAEYLAKNGIPFIICVRRHTAASLLASYARRLAGDPAGERAAALREVGLITRLRLAARVGGPGAPAVDGRLSTHVLDASLGRPAEGVAIELFEVGGPAPLPLGRHVTNADGRTDRPLLSGAPLRIGTYELRFAVGAYFAGRVADQPAFLDIIPVRFAIAEPETHYHVPLLVAPGAYSTYRGS